MGCLRSGSCVQTPADSKVITEFIEIPSVKKEAETWTPSWAHEGIETVAHLTTYVFLYVYKR